MRLSSTLLAAPVIFGASLTLAACGGDDDDTRSDLDGATAAPADAATDAGTTAAPNDGLMPVTLRFKAKVGAVDLACGRDYPGQGSGKVAAKVQDFRMLVQGVTLISSDGRAVPVVLDDRPPFQTPELALLDFTDAKDGCVAGDPRSNTVLTGRVAPGSYTGLRFSNGVPEALNHADPVLAPPPLQAPGLSWSWLQGYRFVVAEMVEAPEAALDGGVATPSDAGAPSSGGGGHNASAATPGLAMVHVGSTSCSNHPEKGASCSRANRNLIELRGFDPAVSTVVADLGAVFVATDIAAGLLCHGLGSQCVTPFGALGIDPATGTALPSQQVFRVE